MTRRARILGITLGLAAAGAVAGGLAGAAAVTIGVLITERIVAHPFVAAYVAVIGGLLGMITAPAIAWLLLRRVPFGQMFLACGTGTVAGGVAGWIIPIAGMQVPGAVLGALIGCVASASALRHGSRRHTVTTAEG